MKVEDTRVGKVRVSSGEETDDVSIDDVGVGEREQGTESGEEESMRGR